MVLPGHEASKTQGMAYQNIPEGAIADPLSWQ